MKQSTLSKALNGASLSLSSYVAVIFVAACVHVGAAVGVVRASEEKFVVSNTTFDFREGVLQLKAGTYFLREPITISGQLPGLDPHAPITIRGSSVGRTKIVGSKTYIGRRLYPYERLPDGLRPSKDLFVIDADEDLERVWRLARESSSRPTQRVRFEVFQDGKRLEPARWPDSGFVRSEVIGSKNPKSASFLVPQDKARDWANVRELEAGGYFGFDWYFEEAAVKSIDSDGYLFLSPLHQPYEVRSGLRYYVANSASDLDRPGEYFVDRSGKRLFVLAFLDTVSDGRFDIPIADTLLRVSGRNNVKIENIEFSLARSAAVRIQNAENVTLQNSRVEHIGGVGVAVVNGKNITLNKLLVRDVGSSGIVLSGGDRQTLTSANNVIRNSVIERTSIRDRTYNASVQLNGVGNAIENSIIRYAPHIGIQFFGNENRIEHNEISYVAQETSDSGAIYTGRDWTWRGNVIRGNFIHDVAPMSGGLLISDSGERRPFEVKGVYLDDMLSGTIIEYNIFLRVMQPVFVGGGRDNRVVGNYIVNPMKSAFHLDARGLTKTFIAAAWKTLESRLESVPFNKPPYVERYPQLALIRSEAPGEPRGNSFRENIIVGGGAYQFRDSAKRFIDESGNVEMLTPLRAISSLKEIVEDIGAIHDDKVSKKTRASLLTSAKSVLETMSNETSIRR